ncbi:unnamed protein product [Didymodactylos carnosus]|uniref:Superoxide dismutase [Cu-Zn] n=1 Tax=Didymodactylos carnosus TaxID=1234261 RepID=A0A816CFL1_9BILA|nr:unnamed protein product [Didymodactylos carnosus]CAF1621320.1 unnamed protein product [Didymodactylos carnosus]CAF3657087.1 unnamed protein product [Didymodactylos carnosus]CAF4511919.1 unnamed protein product [Didymodactylos carnosus]
MLFLVLLVSVFIPASSTGKLHPIFARANVHFDASESVMGTLYFIQARDVSPVIIRGTLTGLEPNQTYHGFHVHEFEVNEGKPNCTAAGGHFNPSNQRHGAPTASLTQRHVGDLGNIYADQYGNATILISDPIIKLAKGSQSILNHTIVIHKDVDDLGLGSYSDSLTTGHAGARLGCGFIRSTSMTIPDAFKIFLS